MRANLAFLAALAIAATPLLSTVARAADFDLALSTRQSNIVRVYQQCPAGEYWENAGYVADGKWREGHCAKISGRQ